MIIILGIKFKLHILLIKMKNLIIKLAKTNKLNKHFTESRQIKKTSLYSFHKDLMKAKMVPFAGYDMPVQYYGIIEEHLHCRDNSCIFDVSHMGQIKLLSIFI